MHAFVIIENYGLLFVNECVHPFICECKCVCVFVRDLQYISIWQYIDTVIEYRIVILCSMNIEVSKWLCSAE